MAKKKVLIYHNVLLFGGITKVAITLANGLADKGMDVYFLTISNEAHPDAAKDISPKVKQLCLNAHSRNSLVFSFWGLLKTVRQLKADVVISTGFFRNVQVNLLKLLCRKTKIILTEHVNFNQNFFSHRSAVIAWAYKAILRVGYIATYRLADHVVGVSTECSTSVERFAFLPPGRVKTIYNPIITPALLKESKKKLSHPWFGKGKPPVLLAVGRFHPLKHFPLLVDAFALLRKRKNARLLILGDGDERQKVEVKIKEHRLGKEVMIPGFSGNPYAYMRQSAMFVLSSEYEGLPTVLVEALACGCPVVATDCPSGPSEILSAGSFGTLVPVNDVKALAAALEKVLSKGVAAKKQVVAFQKQKQNEFTATSVILKYKQLIDK